MEIPAWLEGLQTLGQEWRVASGESTEESIYVTTIYLIYKSQACFLNKLQLYVGKLLANFINYVS